MFVVTHTYWRNDSVWPINLTCYKKSEGVRAYLLATPAVQEIWACLWLRDIKIEFLCDRGIFSILSDSWNSDDASIVTAAFYLSTAISGDNSGLLHLGSWAWNFILDLGRTKKKKILNSGPSTGFFWAHQHNLSSEPSSLQQSTLIQSSKVLKTNHTVRLRVFVRLCVCKYQKRLQHQLPQVTGWAFPFSFPFHHGRGFCFLYTHLIWTQWSHSNGGWALPIINKKKDSTTQQRQFQVMFWTHLMQLIIVGWRLEHRLVQRCEGRENWTVGRSMCLEFSSWVHRV